MQFKVDGVCVKHKIKKIISINITIAVKNFVVLNPITTGKVWLPIFRSPSISSMSLMISLLSVIKKQKIAYKYVAIYRKGKTTSVVQAVQVLIAFVNTFSLTVCIPCLDSVRNVVILAKYI